MQFYDLDEWQKLKSIKPQSESHTRTSNDEEGVQLVFLLWSHQKSSENIKLQSQKKGN